MAEALEKLSRPDLLQKEAQIKIMTAMKNGQALDPFYTLTPEQQQAALRLQTFYPGDKQKSDLTNANIEWLKPYWTARTSYFDELISKGIMQPTTESTAFRASPEMQKKLDYYYTLPYGTGARSAFIRQNPDLVDYWNAKTEDTNAKRSQLGLTPIESGGGFTPYTKKVKKVSLAKVKKAKAPKSFKVKAIKSPKLKVLKPKKYKIAKAKKPKIKVKMPKIPKFA
jgi:hypothetical protein